MTLPPPPPPASSPLHVVGRWSRHFPIPPRRAVPSAFAYGPRTDRRGWGGGQGGEWTTPRTDGLLNGHNIVGTRGGADRGGGGRRSWVQVPPMRLPRPRLLVVE
ncbi:hypothetical protein niasHT_036727 [Heterodera trifolii]|uniref:Uncharacterized protein n=1 Tax=Heterodera trifolii TaxID=157864 RepID=A0ABD2IRT1_9BILA